MKHLFYPISIVRTLYARLEEISVWAILLGISLFFNACSGAVSADQLYGEWKYIKVESPNQRPPYSMPEEEIRADNPSIRFTKQNDLIIFWGGKILSNGKFRMEHDMIRYKENLEGGLSREFPFIIREISKDKIVFETMSNDISRITAIRIN